MSRLESSGMASWAEYPRSRYSKGHVPRVMFQDSCSKVKRLNTSNANGCFGVGGRGVLWQGCSFHVQQITWHAWEPGIGMQPRCGVGMVKEAIPMWVRRYSM